MVAAKRRTTLQYLCSEGGKKEVNSPVTDVQSVGCAWMIKVEQESCGRLLPNYTNTLGKDKNVCIVSLDSFSRLSLDTEWSIRLVMTQQLNIEATKHFPFILTSV